MTGPELAGLLGALTGITAVVLGAIGWDIHRIEAHAADADIQARADRLTRQAEDDLKFAAITSGLIAAPGEDTP
ncbi:hypothetical protein [Kitasatospora indigofera]|uniref:hypothetical protein n=1 Tax=Kitasatospora indigofera TaxID=67307 RepID=UPI00367A3DBB